LQQTMQQPVNQNANMMNPMTINQGQNTF